MKETEEQTKPSGTGQYQGSWTRDFTIGGVGLKAQMKFILVIAAAGQQGGAVARALLWTKGHKIHPLTLLR